MALSGIGLGLVLLGFILLEWFYPVFVELRSGATPGKSAMGLRVVHDIRTPGGGRRVRHPQPAAGGGFPAAVLCGGAGELSGGSGLPPPGGPGRRNPGGSQRAPAQAPGHPRTPGLPTAGDFDLQTQGAVLAFAERCPRLSSLRCSELAEALVGPLGQRGEAAVEAVLGYANWLARGR
ncbi:MAG TPA: RDD family protein [Chromatiaceae bacterium]|nr:RDD family protein [Chromatiaceae bacterium]